jgi:putative sterol carrier protein
MKSGVGQGVDIIYHFKISGEHGGNFTVRVKDGVCTSDDGLLDEPKCVIEAKDVDYEDVEYGRMNAQMAVLMGRIKVSNIGSMLKFVEMFNKA